MNRAELLAIIEQTKARKSEKKVLIQALKGWHEQGHGTLQVGAYVMVDETKAKRIIKMGFARRVDPDKPFEYPTDNVEFAFHEIKLDDSGDMQEVKEPDPEPEPDKISITTFDFLQSSHVVVLNEYGVNYIEDLAGWDIDKLSSIKGISLRTATRLMGAYESYITDGFYTNKDDGMNITEK